MLSSSRVRSRALALALVVVAFARGGLAQEERWHEQPIEPLPPGAVLDDLAFHEDVGYLALRDPGGAGHVLVVRLPDDDGPTFADTGLPARSYLRPVGVSFEGTHVAVTTPVLPVAVLDVAEGSWDTTTYALPPVTSGAQQVEADADGGARFLAVPSFVTGAQAIYLYDGDGWTRHRVNDASSVQVSLLRGPRAVAVSASGGLHVSSDVGSLAEGDAWRDLGEVVLGQQAALPEDASAAWLDERSAVAVLASDAGAWALYVSLLDDDEVLTRDCSDAVAAVAPLGLRRVATANGALHALDRSGRVHRIDDPTSCAAWASGPVSSAFFTDAVGLGAVDEEVALAVGHRQGDGVPVVVWRNRAPTLGAVADVMLDEGGEVTFSLSLSDPDPADRAQLTLEGACEGEAVALSITDDDVTLRALASDDAREQELALRCTLTVDDGELTASRDFMVRVRFEPAPDPRVDAEIELALSAPSVRALDLGDIVRVDAALSSSLPSPLPSLRVTVANGALAVLAGTVELGASPCGASGSARHDDEGLIIEAEGVREGCPLPLHFRVRKGLAREPLRVVSCTFGPEREVLERCRGALSLARPRALGCAQAAPSSTLALAALLALFALVRRRR